MALNALRKALEDGRVVNAAAVLVRGCPVALDSSGTAVVPSSTNKKVVGLSQADKNSFRDDTFGEFAAFGSGMIGILKAGICKVSPSVFDTATGTSTLNVYDPNRTYAVNDKLYCSLSGSDAGLITNNSAARSVDGDGDLLNFVGRVLSAPTASDAELEIDLQTL